MKRITFCLSLLVMWSLGLKVDAQNSRSRAHHGDWEVGMLWVGEGKKRTPLRVEKLRVRSRIDGSLVSTEVTHIFRNHTNKVIEGTFEFRLPQNSTLTRLAMRIHDRWVEGEIEEKSKAKRVYEDIVNQMKDPALLEMKRDRLFQTRIYPIPAKGRKIVVIGYTHLLHSMNGRETYRYRLPQVSNQAMTTD